MLNDYLQFNRRASLRIGKGGQGSLIEITGLRIAFRIAKNLETTSNTATIEVYNLNGDTRNKLRTVFDTVILEAGYIDGEGLKLLFKGDITESSTVRRGPDLITIVRSEDGLKALIETKFNKGYAAGTSPWDILDDIINAIGLPKKISNRLKNIARKKGDKFANAFTSSGSAKKAMDKIVQSLDIRWSVQNGAVKILELGGVDDSPIILLTPATGLLERPIRIYDLKKRENTKKVIEAEKDVQRKGWKLESLLIPDAEPGGRLRVQEGNSEIDGIFKIEEIEQRGDTFGPAWNSNITISDIT